MENNELNSAVVKEVFPLRGYAKGLIWAGFVGLILTVIFWFFGKDMANDGLSGAVFENYVPELILYYTANSLLVLLSGVLLLKRLRFGIYIFLLAFVSVFGSLYIADGGTNLFLWTVTSSMFAIVTGAPLGTLFFIGTLVVNIFKIKMWFKLTS